MSKSTMQMHRRSFEAGSDASYCEREPWDEWGSHSSLSQVEENALKTTTLAGTRTIPSEPPRSTAYYYADLERLKRKDQEPTETQQNPEDLGEYLESNEVVNDGAVREVPPFRDRRQWSLPEYSTPENSRKGPEETYSTAGTFPMPEQKEKEPLLAELEVVGRLPLTQLESASGVRRSRSWYLCCPNVGDEEMSRESSWRYSSLRPVTAPPMPGQNGFATMVASQSSREDISSIRAERDALARALASERQRAAAAARAHDARLAELHGVIAELVRRRAQDKQTRAIPEEEVSDECESSTQPAGELEEDRSRAEQASSAPAPADHRAAGSGAASGADGDTSLNLSEKDSDVCHSTARCCEFARVSGGSCERDHGSADGGVFTASPGRSSARQAKLAARVRLRRVGDPAGDCSTLTTDEARRGAAERLARRAELAEAAAMDGSAAAAAAAAWRARCARLRADCGVLQAALQHAADTAHRLYSACAVHESRVTCVCEALRASDRALEAYDVLLALAETRDGQPERAAAELVGRQLLARREQLGDPLLSPGPWMQHRPGECCPEPWSEALEASLRARAASDKARSVALRRSQPPPAFCSHHDVDLSEIPKPTAAFNMADMEAAVCLQEVLTAREARAFALAAEAGVQDDGDLDELGEQSEQSEHCEHDEHAREHDTSADEVDELEYVEYKTEPGRRSKRRPRHWLAASETDL